MSGTPQQPPLRTLLGRPWWQGVAALVGILALVVAVLALLFQLLLAAEPGNASRDTIECGVGGSGNSGATVKCGTGAAATLGHPSPTPVQSPLLSATPAPAPADTVPGTAIDTYVPPRRTLRPATHPATHSATRPATRPPSTRPTTAAPPPPAVITARDYPTYVAVSRGLTARRVDGQPAADFQVEARGVSPLHGARIAPPGPRGGCADADWTSSGLGFEPAEGVRLCLRTNLGEVGLLDVRPDPGGERLEPYAIRVGRA